MILGVGVDIIEIKRLREMRRKHGKKFLRYCFTEKEIAYCQAKKNPDESFAARFAAKEAVMKALGTGWGNGVSFRNIEIIKHSTDAPIAALRDEAEQVRKKRGVSHFLISLSHCKKYAAAQAIAIAEPPVVG